MTILNTNSQESFLAADLSYPSTPNTLVDLAVTNQHYLSGRLDINQEPVPSPVREGDTAFGITEFAVQLTEKLGLDANSLPSPQLGQDNAIV